MEWRSCSACKKVIPYGGTYYSCSVSSCNKSVYCSVDCWELHVSVVNHKSAGADENRAPSAPIPERGDGGAARRILVRPGTAPAPEKSGSVCENDILIVASKLKNYIRGKAEMNTSADVMEKLSDIVRLLCDEAIREARLQGRKTVLDRDFNFFEQWRRS